MLKEIIHKYKNSKEAKTLTGNFLSLSLLQLAGYIFPLITLPYLARVIGVEKFGILAFASAVMAYFQTFVDFGFNYTAVRDVAQQKDNKEVISIIFSTVMTVRVIFALISLIILYCLILLIPLFRESETILLLTFTYIPAYLLFPEWFFQAMEKMKFITILNLLAKLIFTVLVFIIIKRPDDYYWQPVLSSLGYFTAGIISLIIIKYQFAVNYKMPKFAEIYTTIRDGWDMFLNLFFPNIYSTFSTVLLRAIHGEGSTGIFDAGNKIITIAQQLANTLSRAFFPVLARRIDKHKFYMSISLFIGILISIICLGGADLIIKIFFGEDFKEAAGVLRILSLSIISMFLMNIFGTNYLVLINKEKVLKKIIIWSSLLGFSISWFAVIKWSYIGAAITYLIVRSLIGILTWIIAKKLKRNNKLC